MRVALRLLVRFHADDDSAHHALGSAAEPLLELDAPRGLDRAETLALWAAGFAEQALSLESGKQMASPLDILLNRINAARARFQDARNSVSAIENNYLIQKFQLTQLRESLDNTFQRRLNLQNELANLRNQVSNLEGTLASANSQLSQVRNAISNVADTIAEVSQQIIDARNTKLDVLQELRDLRSNVLNELTLAYEARSKVQLSLNTFTGAYFAKFDLGLGLSFTDADLVELLNGSFSIPRLEFQDLLFSSIPFLKLDQISGYSPARFAFLDANVGKHAYFASERFVDWASPETLLQEIAAGIVTGGLSAQQTLEKTRKQVALEFNDVVAWLNNIGMAEANRIALMGVILPALVGNGIGNINFTDFDHTVEFKPVNYHNRVDLKYFSDLSRKYLGLDEVSAGTDFDIPHAAFQLTLTFDGATPTQAAEAALSKFDQNLFLAEDDVENQFAAALNHVPGTIGTFPEVERILRNLDYSSVVDKNLTQTISRLLVSELGITREQLQLAHAQNPNERVIDLRFSPIEENALELLKPFVFGSRGDVFSSKCEFDLLSSRFDIDVTIVHAEELSLREAFAEVEDWARITGRETLGEVEKLLKNDPFATQEASLRFQFDQAIKRIEDLTGTVAGFINERTGLENQLKNLLGQFGINADQLAQLRLARSQVLEAFRFAGQELNELQDKTNEKIELVNIQVSRFNKALADANFWRDRVNVLVDQYNQLASQAEDVLSSIGLGGLPLEAHNDVW